MKSFEESPVLAGPIALTDAQRVETAAKPRTGWQRHVTLTAKGVVTGALMYYVLHTVNGAEVSHILRTGEWGWLMLAAATVGGAQAVAGLRWALLSEPLALNTNWRRFLSLYFLGSFFNAFLPTAIGGDVVKTYYLARDTRRLARSTTSVLMDRIVGLGGLLIVGCVAAIINGALLRETPVALLLSLFLVGYLVANAVILDRRIHNLVRWILCRLSLVDVAGRLDILFESLAIYRRNLGRMAAMIVVSVGVHMISFVGIFFIGLAIGVAVELQYYLVFLPIIGIVTMLPVSIGGFGVRESAFLTLFVPVGLTPGQSVSLSLLYYIVTAVASLPGAWVYLTNRR